MHTSYKFRLVSVKGYPAIRVRVSFSLFAVPISFTKVAGFVDKILLN